MVDWLRKLERLMGDRVRREPRLSVPPRKKPRGRGEGGAPVPVEPRPNPTPLLGGAEAPVE